jgi:hypothetical protein
MVGFLGGRPRGFGGALKTASVFAFVFVLGLPLDLIKGCEGGSSSAHSSSGTAGSVLAFLPDLGLGLALAFGNGCEGGSSSAHMS